MNVPKGSKNCECTVTPFACMAATPVGATTSSFLCVVLISFRRKVVLPVPALPVKKIWLPVALTKRSANSSLGVEISDIKAVSLKTKNYKNKQTKQRAFKMACSLLNLPM